MSSMVNEGFVINGEIPNSAQYGSCIVHFYCGDVDHSYVAQIINGEIVYYDPTLGSHTFYGGYDENNQYRLVFDSSFYSPAIESITAIKIDLVTNVQVDPEFALASFYSSSLSLLQILPSEDGDK